MYDSGKLTPMKHATHVAGIIAASGNNGKGIAGIAGGNGTAGSGVKLMSTQVQIIQLRLLSMVPIMERLSVRTAGVIIRPLPVFRILILRIKRQLTILSSMPDATMMAINCPIVR